MVLKLAKTNQDERDYFFPGYYNGMLVVVGTKSSPGSARPELVWFWAIVLGLAGPSSTFYGWLNGLAWSCSWTYIFQYKRELELCKYRQGLRF